MYLNTNCFVLIFCNTIFVFICQIYSISEYDGREGALCGLLGSCRCISLLLYNKKFPGSNNMALFEYLSVALSLILFSFFHDASTEKQKNSRSPLLSVEAPFQLFKMMPFMDSIPGNILGMFLRPCVFKDTCWQ